MKPSDFYFCLHNASVREDDPKYTLITFCPIEYWKKNECLPDYFFSDQLDAPEGYLYYGCVEECQWVSEKSPNEIRNELTKLGFTESKEMEDFLTPLWD